MTNGPTIAAVAGAEARSLAPALADILIDCVERGASVSFMSPLSRETAEAFWTDVAFGVERGERLLLVATLGDRRVGTVQVVCAQEENQPHRADVAKMLVHGDARKQGIGAGLMRAAETAARDAGKSLLVLDAVTGGDGERLYERLGWSRVGVIPGYALFPDDRPCDTTFFYKVLGRDS